MKKFALLFSLAFCQSIYTTPIYAIYNHSLPPISLKQEALDEEDTTNDSDGLVEINIIHTNDIHGRSQYVENNVFGFDKLATYIQEKNPDLVVDVGDTFHGQAFATLESGQSIAELINAVGYDVMTPGNHDFNYGKAQLKTLAQLANVTMLAGNIEENGQNFFENNGTFIKDIQEEDGDSLRIGVLGIFDQDIQSETAPRNIEGLEFKNDAQTATSLANYLKNEQNCDLVIALSHQLDCQSFIQNTSNIDILIAGHEHAVFNNEYMDANQKSVQVIEAGKHFENIGELNLKYDINQDLLIESNEKTIHCTQASLLLSDENISQILQTIQERQKATLSQVISQTGYDLEGRWEEIRVQETGIGRLVAASYLEETHADVAFENAGGIRIGRILSKGDITYQDILDIAPFGNYIVTKQITGNDLLSIVEKSIDTGCQNKKAYDEWIKTNSDQVKWPDNSGSYLQFSGMNIQYDPSKEYGHRVISIQIKDQPLNPEALYTIATNNFIALGDDYPELKNAAQLNQYSACDEAITRFVLKGQSAVDESTTKIGLHIQHQEDQQQPKPNPETKPETKPENNIIKDENHHPTATSTNVFKYGLLLLISFGIYIFASITKKRL